MKALFKRNLGKGAAGTTGYNLASGKTGKAVKPEETEEEEDIRGCPKPMTRLLQMQTRKGGLATVARRRGEVLISDQPEIGARI